MRDGRPAAVRGGLLGGRGGMELGAVRVGHRFDSVAVELEDLKLK